MNIHEHGFLIQQTKLRVTFGSSVNDIALRRQFGRHFLVAWEWNAAQILILHNMKCMTHIWILLTFQGHAPFKFLEFMIISRWQGRKMALTSLNVYTTSHPIHQTSSYVSCHWLPVWILGAAIPLARWKVNLRWPSAECRQIQITQWIVWVWF